LFLPFFVGFLRLLVSPVIFFSLRTFVLIVSPTARSGFHVSSFASTWRVGDSFLFSPPLLNLRRPGSRNDAPDRPSQFSLVCEMTVGAFLVVPPLSHLLTALPLFFVLPRRLRSCLSFPHASFSPPGVYSNFRPPCY